MTGGSGFIGSHLCQRLLKQGHDVLVVDNFYSSSRRNVIDPPAEVTGPVNLGNPGELTMVELATKVLALVGADRPVEHHPLPADDPVRR